MNLFFGLSLVHVHNYETQVLRHQNVINSRSSTVFFSVFTQRKGMKCTQHDLKCLSKQTFNEKKERFEVEIRRTFYVL